MPKLIAHRGSVSTGVPENSIGAFESALELGADGIEFDVRLTSDHEAVVFHDPALADGTPVHSVAAHNLPRLLGGYEIPALRDVLKAFAGRAFLEIELKSLEPAVIDVVIRELAPYRQHWDSMEVLSFEPVLLRCLRDVATISTDLLTGPGAAPEAHVVQRALLAAAHGVHMHCSQLSDAFVASIRAAGLDVHCWGANSHEYLDAVHHFGVDRFNTDHVADARAWIAGR